MTLASLSPGLLTLFSRAIRLHCPNCGDRTLFASWFRMRDQCGNCHLRTERGEQGYVVGAYMFNIVAAELGWAIIMVAVVAASWPSPPWDWLLYGGGVLMLVLPLLLYPFSKATFLAFDLLFRPERKDE